MAKLDGLLRALVKHGMDDLLLESGRLPRLRRGKAEHEVTKNRLDAATINGVLREIAPDGRMPDLSGGAPWEFGYALDGRLFHFVAVATGAGWSVIATDGGEAAEEEREEEPPAQPEAPAEPDRPVPGVAELLTLVVERGASDLHLSSGQLPRMRLDGDLKALDGFLPPASDDLQRLLEPILPQRNREQFAQVNDTDFAWELAGQARFRVNVFRDRLGVGAVFRQIPYQVPSFEELGLPASLRELAYLSKGLVLVTGPTGSGKSTTLAAILNLINQQRHDHIITIEDPIEFVHTSQGCLVNQREVGVHTGSFKHALRAALREDPDIVLVGEMRDLETIAIAVETAETGHLVFGTLHTTTAPSTVERLVDQFPGDRQEQIRMMLADGLKAVIAQTLLKRIGGGRVAAFEILICTAAVSNLIREGKTFQIASAMQTGRKQGMVMLNDSLVELVTRKVVAPEEAYIKAVDKTALASKLAAAGFELQLEKAPVQE